MTVTLPLFVPRNRRYQARRRAFLRVRRRTNRTTAFRPSAPSRPASINREIAARAVVDHTSGRRRQSTQPGDQARGSQARRATPVPPLELAAGKPTQHYPPQGCQSRCAGARTGEACPMQTRTEQALVSVPEGATTAPYWLPDPRFEPPSPSHQKRSAECPRSPILRFRFPARAPT
jgi:hypothetical protein